MSVQVRGFVLFFGFWLRFRGSGMCCISSGVLELRGIGFGAGCLQTSEMLHGFGDRRRQPFVYRLSVRPTGKPNKP